MNGRLMKMCFVVVAFMVTTSSAWASSAVYKVYARGIDWCGHTTSRGGQCQCFYACLNTCTGYFTGKAYGEVENCSGYDQHFYNKNYFCDPCWAICVDWSKYCVSACGCTSYVACGYARKICCGTIY